MTAAGLISAFALAAASTGSAAGAEAVSVSQLKERTHIHGLAVDREDSQKLLIATHHGLFRAGPDGKAELISPVQDFMGFTPNPSDPRSLYASGHPAGGGNLGFIASTDNGATWTQVAPGANGPVDFHQMTVSSANPRAGQELLVIRVGNGVERLADVIDGAEHELQCPALPADDAVVAAGALLELADGDVVDDDHGDHECDAEGHRKRSERGCERSLLHVSPGYFPEGHWLLIIVVSSEA
jgi:hypothetical protein